jgi:hypothetical protein
MLHDAMQATPGSSASDLPKLIKRELVRDAFAAAPELTGEDPVLETMVESDSVSLRLDGQNQGADRELGADVEPQPQLFPRPFVQPPRMGMR